VLSPGSAEYDLDIKRRANQRAGVPEYAIVDAVPRSLFYFRLSMPCRAVCSISD
jgi:Uma2 family endonuclease